MKYTLKSRLFAIAAFAFTGTSALLFTSCEDRPKTLGEKIEDGLDTRPNEGLKDAGEDVQDGVKDAGEGIKDAANETKDAVKDATN
jgi:hypothetical protein